MRTLRLTRWSPSLRAISFLICRRRLISGIVADPGECKRRSHCLAGHQAIALGRVIIAGGIVVHGAVGIAAGGVIGAGKIFHRISHVGIGVEQTGSVALIAHGPRGAELDLHQTVIAGAHDARVTAALAADHAAHQLLRHAIGGRLTGDQRIEIAVGIERCGVAAMLCGNGRYGSGERKQSRCNKKMANHVGSVAGTDWRIGGGGSAAFLQKPRQVCGATA